MLQVLRKNNWFIEFSYMINHLCHMGGRFSNNDPRPYGNVLGECADVCHLYGNVLGYHPLIGCMCVECGVGFGCLGSQVGYQGILDLGSVCEWCVWDQLARELPLWNKRHWKRTRSYSSYTLGREYPVMRNRYSRLLFTSEDRLCANLHVQD